MKKNETKEAKQNSAIKNCLLWFLKEFDRARYSIDEPVKTLEKYFDLHSDGDWLVYIFMQTAEWKLTMGYTMDIDLADLQNVINYLKARAKNYLWFNYNIDA